MAGYKIRDVRKAFTGKLHAREDRSRRHQTYTFYDDDNRLMGQTYISHGHSEIDISMIGRMAKELGVETQKMRLAIECPLSRVELLALMENSAD